MAEGEEELNMEEDQYEESQSQQGEQSQAATARGGKRPKDPCIICGKNSTGGAIQCNICLLWCHNKCSGLSAEILRGLALQAKELNMAYWACRSCTGFNQKVNAVLKDVHKRQEETEKQVERNKKRIEEVNKVAEGTREGLKKQAELIEDMELRLEQKMASELRERENRRLNLIIHGIPEQAGNIVQNRERMERDKQDIERVFQAAGVNTRANDLRFCRRIGERGSMTAL